MHEAASQPGCSPNHVMVLEEASDRLDNFCLTPWPCKLRISLFSRRHSPRASQCNVSVSDGATVVRRLGRFSGSATAHALKAVFSSPEE